MNTNAMKEIMAQGYTIPSALNNENAPTGYTDPMYVYTFNAFDENGESVDMSINKGIFNIDANTNLAEIDGKRLIGYSGINYYGTVINLADIDGLPSTGGGDNPKSNAE